MEFRFLKIEDKTLLTLIVHMVSLQIELTVLNALLSDALNAVALLFVPSVIQILSKPKTHVFAKDKELNIPMVTLALNVSVHA